MKKQLIIAAFLSFAAILSAQSNNAMEYNRNAVSNVIISYNDAYNTHLIQQFLSLPVSDRYDCNQIETRKIPMGGSRVNKTTSASGVTTYKIIDRDEMITQFLNDEKIGNQIVASLFKRNAQGQFSMAEVHNRGMYNANDEDFNTGNLTKRGSEDAYIALKDKGNSLVGNSYITVYDYANLRYELVESSTSKDWAWRCDVVAYLFKIEWNEELYNKLLTECWVEEGDGLSETEVAQRIAQFDAMSIPLKLVSRSTKNHSIATGIVSAKESAKQNGKKLSDKKIAEMKETAFCKMVVNGIDDSYFDFESKYTNFMIKVSLSNIDPLRAKIGKKESLKSEDRYYVMESLLGDDEKTITYKRRGVIKATKHIADNRGITGGNTKPSEFYQIAGRSLEQGQTLVEKKSLNLAIDLGCALSFDATSLYIDLMQSLYMTKHSQLYYGLAFFYTPSMSDYFNTRIVLGYGLRMNNFETYPYLSLGYTFDLSSESLDTLKPSKVTKSTTTSTSNVADASSVDFGVGVRANLNIYYPFQIFGQLEYLMATEFPIGGYAVPNGLNFAVGLRYCF